MLSEKAVRRAKGRHSLLRAPGVRRVRRRDSTGMMQTFEIRTGKFEMIDVTSLVRGAVRDTGISDGICTVYCPHTTAAITINENADPDVQRDLLLALGDIFADRREFRHCEGNSHAHLKSSVVGGSETIPVSDGRLVLGTWQGIYFCEFDGPRTRRFHVQVVGS